MMRVPSPRGVHNRLAGMASWGWARRLHGARNSIKTMASVNVRSFVQLELSRCIDPPKSLSILFIVLLDYI